MRRAASSKSTRTSEPNPARECDALAFRELFELLLRHGLQPEHQVPHFPFRRMTGQDQLLRLRAHNVGHPVVQVRRAPPSNGETACTQTTASFDLRQWLPADLHRLRTVSGFRPVT